jgi:hypothetical protein
MQNIAKDRSSVDNNPPTSCQHAPEIYMMTLGIRANRE